MFLYFVWDEQRRREEEENKLRIKRQAEEAARARQNAAKREKENAKRALKREREQLHKYGKQFNYFIGRPTTSAAADEAELVNRMADLDRLCELLPIDESDFFFFFQKCHSQNGNLLILLFGFQVG